MPKLGNDVSLAAILSVLGYKYQRHHHLQRIIQCALMNLSNFCSAFLVMICLDCSISSFPLLEFRLPPSWNLCISFPEQSLHLFLRSHTQAFIYTCSPTMQFISDRTFDHTISCFCYRRCSNSYVSISLQGLLRLRELAILLLCWKDDLAFPSLSCKISSENVGSPSSRLCQHNPREVWY